MSLPAFYRGLAQLERAGLVAGDALARLHETGVLRLPGIARDVAAGESLSSALARHPDHVPPEDVALIRAGEETGNLGASLDRLAGIHEERARLWQDFRNRVRYPVIVFHVAAVCIPIGLTAMRDWERWTLGILGLAWGVVGLVFWMRRTAVGRARVRAVTDRLPGFGTAARHRRQSVFASILAAGHEAGLTLDRAAALAGGAASIDAAVRAAPVVTAGTPLGPALARERALPAQLLARITTAETAGDLSAELERITREEADNAGYALDRAVEYTTKGFFLLLGFAVFLYAMKVVTSVYT